MSEFNNDQNTNNNQNNQQNATQYTPNKRIRQNLNFHGLEQL